jgi:hypothetical protein
MKKILFALIVILPSLAWAQLSTVNPDTVCYQTGGSLYSVPASAGLIYNWTVAPPGIILGGQGTNQLQVDWSTASPGTIINAVQVQAVNQLGCLGPLVTLDVFIYAINPILTPIADMCENAACVNLNASPAGGTWSGTGVLANQFCPGASGAGTFTVTYEYSDAGCTVIGAMQVNVVPIPTLLPIQHN